MGVLWRSLRRTADAALLLRCPYLSWGEKAKVMLSVLLRRSRAAPDLLVRLAFGQAVLSMTPCYYPDFAVFRDIFLKQVYGIDYRNSTVVDCGAHKGYFTAFAAMKGAHRIVCYEPDESNYEALVKVIDTIGGGQRGQVVAHRQAVAAEDGIACFHVYEKSWSHSLIERSDCNAVCQVHVPTRALAGIIRDAVESARSGRVIMKMDIEGAECSAIPATDPDVLGQLDELFVETHSYAACSRQDLIRHLDRAQMSVRATSDPDVLRFVREAS